MPRKCCINGCSNSFWNNCVGKKAVTFHSFPKNTDEHLIWRTHIRISNSQEIVGKNSVVCSDHFHESDIVRSKTKVILKKHAISTVFPYLYCTDYEILYPETIGPNLKRQSLHSREENKENIEPNSKQPKFHVDNVAMCDSNVNHIHESLLIKPVNVSSVDVSYVSSTMVNLVSIVNCDDDSGMSATDERVQSVDISANISTSSSSPLNNTSPVEFQRSLNTSFSGHSTPKSSRRIRYPGDIDESVDISPKTARSYIKICKGKITMQAKKIYRFQQTTKRQKKQIESLKDLLRILKMSYGQSTHAVQSIESTFEDDIITQLKEGRRTRSHSENVKSFALTLNFFSNAAYKYVRETFGNHLPCESTLSKWYKVVNGDPGTSAEAFAILKDMADVIKKDNKKLFGALFMDEMAIRTQLIWNEGKRDIIGYVDYRHETEVSDSTEEASDALVFMVVPINARGKVPVAYYYTNKMAGEEKATVLMNLIRVLDETGIDIISFIFDGSSNNFTMSESLGPNLNFKINMTPFFEHPTTIFFR